jgi:hypothetical protein
MSEIVRPPLTSAQLWELDDPPVEEDSRPFGLMTASASTFWTDESGDVGLVRSDLHDRAYALRSRAVIHEGLPVRESTRAEAFPRSVGERIDAAALRDRRGRGPSAEGKRIGEPYRPQGVPSGMHPKLVASVAETRYGISARGVRIRLSEEPHSTIINGESRQFLYPDRYPYTAVCKLVLSHQPRPGAAWDIDGQATGFLIGRSTMMTSGHVRPPDGLPWRIQVIPACWACRSVFGPGLITYVRSATWWHSDSGNDIQICQLYDAVGDQLGYFGFRTYDSDWQDMQVWVMAGFPYDRSLTSMSAQSGIAVRDDDDGDDIDVNGTRYDTTQVESDADEASGASGAPLFGWWDDGPYAIGTHAGVEYDTTVSGTEILSCASGGDGFVAAAGWGRDMWG